MVRLDKYLKESEIQNQLNCQYQCSYLNLYKGNKYKSLLMLLLGDGGLQFPHRVLHFLYYDSCH